MYVWETSSTATEHNAHLFLAETWEKSTYLELLFLLEPLGGGMRVPLCLKFQPSQAVTLQTTVVGIRSFLKPL